MRLQISAKHPMQIQNYFAPELSAPALIRLTGIGETVAEYNLAGIQCRKNDFLDVLHARSKHQGQFRHWIETAGPGIQQQLADLFSGFGATRFSCQGY